MDVLPLLCIVSVAFTGKNLEFKNCNIFSCRCLKYIFTLIVEKLLERGLANDQGANIVTRVRADHTCN